MAKSLTYVEFVTLAHSNYLKGGEGICEYWDEALFKEYVRMFGPMTKRKALQLIKAYEQQEKINDLYM